MIDRIQKIAALLKPGETATLILSVQTKPVNPEDLMSEAQQMIREGQDTQFYSDDEIVDEDNLNCGCDVECPSADCAAEFAQRQRDDMADYEAMRGNALANFMSAVAEAEQMEAEARDFDECAVCDHNHVCAAGGLSNCDDTIDETSIQEDVLAVLDRLVNQRELDELNADDDGDSLKDFDDGPFNGIQSDELDDARTCIASLLGRIDDLMGVQMLHSYGPTPTWYVEAAAISCGIPLANLAK